MSRIVFAAALALAGASPAHALTRNEKIKLEADYILQCQYLSSGDPAHGAINNVYGDPTWIVPRENALAILGLIEASRVLATATYRQRAELAADYLIRVQDTADGAWYDQYNRTTPDAVHGKAKSPTQTAETMMALYALGYRSARYAAMKRGAQYLLACANPANKQGSDDGLLGGGKDASGAWHTWRWASDNAFAYQAMRAAEAWAMAAGDFTSNAQFRTAAERIVNGINARLFVASTGDPDHGVWRRAVDRFGNPQETTRHEWINYAPQMLDVPAQGVGSAAVGTWIHNKFQKSDGSVVWDDLYFTQRKSPGFSFQAALAWLDLKQAAYSTPAVYWAESLSGLWQTAPDERGIAGGWIDWTENGTPAPYWQRFIDTSFYAIATWLGRYDFRIVTDFPVGIHPGAPALVDLDADGRNDIVLTQELSWEVQAYRGSGLPVPGWPVGACGAESVQSAWAPAAVADIDADGKPEVVVAMGAGSGKAGVCAWEHDGRAKWWRALPSGVGTVAIANLDNIGAPEIIFTGDVIAVLSASGAVLPGWPKHGAGFRLFSAIADLDEDGFQDIVFTSGSQVTAVNRSGAVLPGWPVSMGGRGESPAIGDINGDGHLEVVATDVYSYGYAWDRRGQLLNGWPVRATVPTPMGAAAPVLADIDGDPQAEVLVGTASNGIKPNDSSLYIWNGDGSGIAEFGLGEYYPGDQPIAVNLDSGKSPNEVLAINKGGAVVIWPARSTWPKQTPQPGMTWSPAVGDVNNDGKAELVAVGADTAVIMLTTGPAGAPQSQAWPTARANNARTGSLPVILPKNEPPVLAPIGHQDVNAGETLVIQLSATDPEGKPLTYTVDTYPATGTWDPATGRFTWTPGFGETGPFNYLFGVTDGVLSDFESIVITVHQIPLTLTGVSDAPDPFSPNADARKDTTTIKGQFNHDCGWELQIKNAVGGVVRSFGGGGTTVNQVWNGKNTSGGAVANGTFTYTLTGTDAGLQVATVNGTVTVDTVRPTLSSLADSPDPFTPSAGQTSKVTFSLSESSRLTMQVFNASGALVRTLVNNALRNAGANTVIWDGKTSAGALSPPGTYTYRLWVEDRAGNRAATYPYAATAQLK